MGGLPLKGNYRDDYKGLDILPPYGIGDIPYTIPPDSLYDKDRFPFMEPVDIDDVVIIDVERDLIEFEIEIPRNKATYNSLFLQFLERFPLLERLLNLI